MEFKAAGILFTDGKQFLTGLQSRDGFLVFDGFGGSREEGEDSFTTALRETFEEMFQPETNLAEAVVIAKEQIKPQNMIQRGSYVMYVCNLENIVTFCKIAKQARLVSPLYKIIPSSLATFLHKRQITDTSEIKEVMLITPEHASVLAHPIADTFMKDMEILLTK